MAYGLCSVVFGLWFMVHRLVLFDLWFMVDISPVDSTDFRYNSVNVGAEKGGARRRRGRNASVYEGFREREATGYEPFDQIQVSVRDMPP